MHKKYLKILLILLIIFLVSGFFVEVAEAGDLGSFIKGELNRTQGYAKLPAYTNPTDIIALVIKGALSVVVVIFLLMIIISGFRWMTAGGNEETVTKAKKNIMNAVIGVVIIMFSYAITVLIFDVILGKTTS